MKIFSSFRAPVKFIKYLQANVTIRYMVDVATFCLQRAGILKRLADLLLEREARIMEENKKDLKVASSLSAPLKSRLQLSHPKLLSLSEGLHQLADDVVKHDNVGEVIRRTLIGEGLTLVQQKVPIGVLLVIFESRPDCLIQVR